MCNNKNKSMKKMVKLWKPKKPKLTPMGILKRT